MVVTVQATTVPIASGSVPGALKVATQYVLKRRLLGSNRDLYGQQRLLSIVGLRSRDVFG